MNQKKRKKENVLDDRNSEFIGTHHCSAIDLWRVFKHITPITITICNPQNRNRTENGAFGSNNVVEPISIENMHSFIFRRSLYFIRCD